LAQNESSSAAGKLFADILKAPTVQILVRRLEDGGVLPCAGICASARPFFAALLQNIFPSRPILIVTPDLKTQENFQQDLETWLRFGRGPNGESRESGKAANVEVGSRSSTFDLRPLFYPAWEVFPHEDKLPPADVISDRLQTLVALSENSPRAARRWLSPVSRPCCKKRFRPAKSKSARAN